MPHGTRRIPCDVYPSTIGCDAYSTDSTYYTAGTTGNCVSNALAGMLCSTGPAAQPVSGKPLPVTTVTGYNMYDEPLVVTETAGSVVRTTATTYDAAGRKLTSTVTVTPSGRTDGDAVANVRLRPVHRLANDHH